MRGRSFKRARAAADACMELQVLADTAQREGMRHRAAVYRWRAARRALEWTAAARRLYGLPIAAQLRALGAARIADYLR